MKRLFMNLKLSKKIMIAPLVVIAFLVISGIVSYVSLSSQKSAVEEIFGTRFKSFQTSARLIKDATSVHANLYKVISWATANYDTKKIDALGKEQVKVLEGASATVGRVLQDKKLTPEVANAYKTAMAALTAYQKDAVAALDLAGSDLNMATMFMGTADEKFQALYKTLNDLLDLETKLGQVTYEGSLAGFNTSLTISSGVMVTAIIVSLLLSFMIAKIITTPIHRAIAVIQKIAEGDLTQEITLTSKDEIGMLAQSVDAMRQKMGEAVGGSVATSQSLSAAASEQASSIEETSASLEELASMTKMNTENTNQANSLMMTTKGVIQQANHSMNDLTKSMSEIAQAGEQTQKIVKTIDEIAFQTNLLALNAAVEAARAGEVGAGFAVVADEVRNLAKRAAEAAKNTSNLMADIVKKIRAGGELVLVTNTAFKEVSSGSDKVVNLIGEIVSASQEQSQGIDQINQAIAQMNGVTQQNAASAEELAAAMAMFKTNRHDAARRNEVVVA